MKEKKSIIERISSGKGFYITAALSFAVIIIAIAFVYNSSVNMLRDLDIPTTLKQVEKNQTNVSDPRKYEADEDDSVEKETATSPVPKITEPTTIRPTTTTTQKSTVEALSNDSYMLPLSGDVDRKFSSNPVYDETMEDWRTHKGIDFLGNRGDDVLSIGNGKVSKVIFDPTFGYTIEVDYGNLIGRYCGIDQVSAVGIDDIVTKGSIIGKIGDIPCESKQESHLHFEVVKSGVTIDPMEIF
jgi:murein DD-endopeptidase MepM/ murein hydrolase activator NlpD